MWGIKKYTAKVTMEQSRNVGKKANNSNHKYTWFNLVYRMEVERLIALPSQSPDTTNQKLKDNQRPNYRSWI